MAVMTFTVGGLFMELYSMACDTILQCFLVDSEVNGGVANNCPSAMKEFVDGIKKNEWFNITNLYIQ